MNLDKNGKLLTELRKSRGMTQKQVADMLGVLPKTVSKWETGHGFPDTSLLAELAGILGVSVDTLLAGSLNHNTEEVGNFKRIRFYVCPHCGSFFQGVGKCQISCCGKQLVPLEARPAGGEHTISVQEIENDYYLTFEHEMSKEHYISFAAYVACDRVLTVRLYPEQDCSARFPRLFGGKFYFYCSEHGLFEYDGRKKAGNSDEGASLTALMSAFSRAYVNKNSSAPIFRDEYAQKLFTPEELGQLEGYISAAGVDTAEYIYENLAPTPLARSKFCEDALEAAVMTGTSQLVIPGCGYDTFEFRNTHPGLRIFEIDKPSTIDDKMKRIRRAGLEIPENAKYIPADLSAESLKSVLEKNGFDFGKKTFFSCLGLVYYLAADEVAELFGSIAEFAAAGSTIAFDFADSHLFSSTVPRVKNMLAMAEKSGEPMKCCFGYGELEKMLEDNGLLMYEFLNREDIQDRFFVECRGMSAFESVNFAQAVVFKGNAD